jgi:hypothetical protein
MQPQIEYVRLFVDDQGASHMEKNLKVDFEMKDFAPPAPAIGVSALQPASGCAFLSVPAGYIGDMHPSPKRQWVVFVSGQMEFETSDGDRFLGRPGSLVLLEDTSGVGHRSTVSRDAPAVMLAVQL